MTWLRKAYSSEQMGLNPELHVSYKVPKTVYYLKDHLGSTRVVVDEDGDVVESYDYFPFGLASRTSGGGTVYKFTEKELDNETDFYYFGARYYDPDAGRWLSVDPFASLRPDVSPYAYCGNNPICRIDPFGLVWRWAKLPDGEGWGWMWEQDESVVVTAGTDDSGSDNGSSVPNRRPPSHGIGLRPSWFDRNLPLATQNDSWLYRAFRGTGDIKHDMNSFVLGVPAISFATVAVGAGGTFVVINYGGIIITRVVGWGTTVYIITQKGYIEVQRDYNWVLTYGNVFANRLWNTAVTRGRIFYNAARWTYISNAQIINDISISFCAGKGWCDYMPTTPWGWISYGVGMSLPFP